MNFAASRGIATAIAVLSACLCVPISLADIDGDRFQSEEWRIKMTGPKGWAMREENSYPSVLLWMSRRRPRAVMLLGAERLDKPVTVAEYAAGVARKLANKKFQVRAPQLHSATGAFWSEFDDGENFLRQAVLVPEGMGVAFSLTLRTSSARARTQMQRSFESALRSIATDRRNAKSTLVPSAETGSNMESEAPVSGTVSPAVSPGSPP